MAPIQGSPCDVGWTEVAGSCFRLSERNLTWEEGEQFCQSRGATLAKVDSQDLISGLIEKQVIKTRTWIGLTDRDNEGTFKWLDNTAPKETFWRVNRLEGRSDDLDCVAVGVHGNWIDIDCNDEKEALCQKENKTCQHYGNNAFKNAALCKFVEPQVFLRSRRKTQNAI